MRRLILPVLVLACAAAPCRADRMADLNPLARAATTDAVVLGTVTEIEKETVDAEPYPGAGKVAFTVALVKVETAVSGLPATTTLVKVGFVPVAPGKRRYPQPELKVDQSVCLFLDKHPTGGFYVMPGLAPPLDRTDATKASVDEIVKAGAVYADPAKALKAEKAEDRAFAARALVQKYRNTGYRAGVQWTTADVPLEESQLVLKAIADGDWTATGDGSPLTLLTVLGLGDAEKFRPPTVKPGEDTKAAWQKQFTAWLAADGAKCQLKRFVPKEK